MLEQRRLLSAAITFGPATQWPESPGKPFAVAVGEINGDGYPSIVIANSNGTVSILHGYGNGQFAAPITVADGLPNGAGTPQDLAIGYGGKQIFVTNPQAAGNVTVLQSDGSGNFSAMLAPDFAPAGAYVTAIATGSFVGYGFMAFGDSDGEVALCGSANDGTGNDYSGGTHFYSVTTSVPNEIAMANSTGQRGELAGTPEIFVQDSSGQMHTMDFPILADSGQNPGQIARIVSLNTGPVDSSSFALADVNGDGITDLVIGSNTGGVYEFVGTAGGFTAGPSAKVAPSDNAYGINVQIADTYAQGYHCVLLTEYTAAGASVQPLLASPSGALTPSGSPFYSSTPLKLADVAGDGGSDLVAAYYHSSGHAAGATVRLRAHAPVFNSADSASFADGIFNTFTVSIDGRSSALTESGALPPGVTFHDNGNNTATISGIPAQLGPFNITLSANDGTDAVVTQSFTLNVAPPVAAEITSAAATVFAAGQSSKFTFTATGLPVPALSESGRLPAGLSFTANANGTAILTGVPAVGAAGVYDVTITAVNGFGTPATQAFVLTVDAPAAITSPASTTFDVNAPGTFTFTTSGYPTASILCTGTLPQGVTLTTNGNGTETLAGTPSPLSTGVYPLLISATNGAGATVMQNFVLTVDEPPIFVSANNAEFTAGTNASIGITAEGYPDPTITESGALPAGMEFSAAADSGTALLYGIPAARAGGTYVITLSATSGIGAPVVQTFTLNVLAAPSITTPDSAAAAAGENDTITFAALGSPAPALSLSGDMPAGLTIVGDSGGILTIAGTPSKKLTGTFTLDITATNAAGTSTQPFTLTLGKPKAARITSGNTAGFTVGQFNSIQVYSTGDSTPSLTETGTLPSGLTFADNGDGTATISGTPVPGSGGVYTLSLIAANSAGKAATQTFTITVDEPASFTTASATFTAGSYAVASIHANGYPAVALSEWGNLPAGLTFTATGNGNAIISGTPLSYTAGAYPLTLLASPVGSSSKKKGKGAAFAPVVSQSYVLYVNQGGTLAGSSVVASGLVAPSITSGNAVTLPAGKQGSFAITTAGVAAASISAGPLPAGLTFTDNGNGTGIISGLVQTPGLYRIDISGSDGVGSIVTQVLDLTVG